MKNKKVIGILVIVVAVVLVFAAFMVVNAINNNNKEMTEETPMTDSKEDTQMEEETTFKGDAYNFKMLDTDGNTHTLEQYAGKKVYVKFWATWCPSCLEGLEELGQLHEQTKDREDIVILTVVAPGYSGEKSSEKFIEWYEGQELKFTVLLDEGGNAFYEYGIRAVPSSFYIDEKGNLAETSLGHVGNEKVLETLGSIH